MFKLFLQLMISTNLFVHLLLKSIFHKHPYFLDEVFLLFQLNGLSNLDEEYRLS